MSRSMYGVGHGIVRVALAIAIGWGGVPGLRAQDTGVAASSPTWAEKHTVDALLARRVTAHLTNVSRRAAIDALSRDAKVFVQYLVPVLTAHPGLVSLDVSNTPLGVALERVLDGTPLRVSTDGAGHLTIVDASAARGDSTPSTRTVAGDVMDSASRRKLAGVSIQVEVQGRKRRATTNTEGHFTLADIPPGEYVIVARLFGYRPMSQTVAVGAETAPVRFQLVSVPNVLSQVVTTATGKQRKLEVGSDITALNVDSLQQVAPITSVTDLLEARVPGLVVMRSSGVPGAPSRIRLRGIGSVTRNNDPIVVIDGVRMYAQQDPARHLLNSESSDSLYSTPSPLDQLDPNSIETIEVLKGPSASAIYGSDAGNGVIVITTKRGRNGPAQWSVSADAGLSMQPGDFPVGVYRFGHHLNTLSQLCWLGDLSCALDSVVRFQALNDDRYSILSSHGVSRDVTGTVSGGTNNLLYSLTASASRTLGQLKLPDIETERFSKFYNLTGPPNWMRRPDRYATQGGTSQLTIPFGHNNAQVTLSSSLFTSFQQQSSLQQGLSQLAATYVDTSQLGATPLIGEFFTRVTSDQEHTTNSITARWGVTSWLPLEATAGTDRIDATTQKIRPRRSKSYTLNAGQGDSVGSYAIERDGTRSNTVTLATTIPTRITRIAAGFNYVSTTSNDIRAEIRGIPIGVDIPTTLGPATTYPSQNIVSSATYGWYVAPQFNFSSRFFVSPAIRLDGGSASGARVSVGGLKGVSGFPKIDFSWLAVDPSKSDGTRRGVVGALTSLRVRTAFGTAGVQPAPGDNLRLLRDTVMTWEGQVLNPIEITGLGNTKLRPERSRELEGGGEAEFWGGRAVVQFTQYQKMRYDAILSKPVAPSILPELSVSTNIGRISNTGTDLSLDAQLLQRAALGWHVNMTMSRQANRVISLVAGQAPFEYPANGFDGTVTRIAVGYPIDGRWAKPIVGYADLNNDGIIQPKEVLVGDSLQYVGSQLPNYQLGFNTDVSLLGGRLTFHTQLFFQDGLTQLNAAAKQAVNAPGIPSGALNAGVVFFGNDPSIPLNQQAAYAAALSGQTSIGLLQVVNTLRWQTLSVNYAAPAWLTQVFRSRRLSFALQGSNLWLHTNYRGKDPNVNSLPAGELVQDSGALPLPRTASLKVTVGN